MKYLKNFITFAMIIFLYPIESKCEELDLPQSEGNKFPEININGDGQDKYSWGVEYGTSPTYGFYFGTSSKEKRGYYFDIKSSFKEPDKKDVYGFSKTYASNTLGDRQVGSTTDIVAMNIGVIYGVHNNISLIGAIGLVNKTEYLSFYDNTGILGTGNTYYIKNSDKNSMNALLGTLFYLDKVNLKIQYETATSSVAFGIGGVF